MMPKQLKITRITVEPLIGDWIETTARGMQLLADEHHCEVCAAFNRTPLVAHPGDDLVDILVRYEEARR